MAGAHQGSFADAEDIGSLTAHHLADELSALTGAAHDLLPSGLTPDAKKPAFTLSWDRLPGSMERRRQHGVTVNAAGDPSRLYISTVRAGVAGP